MVWGSRRSTVPRIDRLFRYGLNGNGVWHVQGGKAQTAGFTAIQVGFMFDGTTLSVSDTTNLFNRVPAYLSVNPA
ncbi:hypothetical protein Q3C01_42960 [Bradyrhizobium sp. UFLA05-109]